MLPHGAVSLTRLRTAKDHMRSGHEVGTEAPVFAGRSVRTGRRIAGIAVGVDRACVGVHGNVGTGAGAVVSPVLGRGRDCRGAPGRRVAGVFMIVSRAGHRTQHDRRQDQRGKT